MSDESESQPAQKRRRTFFHDNDVALLVELVRKHEHIESNKSTGAIERKRQAWRMVEKEYNEYRRLKGGKKTLQELKTKYKNYKSLTKKELVLSNSNADLNSLHFLDHDVTGYNHSLDSDSIPSIKPEPEPVESTIVLEKFAFEPRSTFGLPNSVEAESEKFHRTKRDDDKSEFIKMKMESIRLDIEYKHLKIEKIKLEIEGMKKLLARNDEGLNKICPQLMSDDSEDGM